jgi:prepilin-type N-terminal cleavage/methylation domain-containing protein
MRPIPIRLTKSHFKIPGTAGILAGSSPQRNPGKVTGAFTLIELLVVVAIIAILAAIAIPNLMEAQTRAKAAAVKSDLRVLATVLEIYAVDHTKYPPARGVGDSYDEFSLVAEQLSARFAALTTPVGYIASIPRDLFLPRDGWGSPELDLYDTFDYIDADAIPARGSALTNGGEWRIVSAGPDLYQAYGGRPVADRDCNAMGVDYDPTNGTVSTGDIARVGPFCKRPSDPLDPANPGRPGIVRVPSYVEQWQ